MPRIMSDPWPQENAKGMAQKIKESKYGGAGGQETMSLEKGWVEEVGTQALKQAVESSSDCLFSEVSLFTPIVSAESTV